MLSFIYSPILLLKPTARTPTAIVRMIRIERDLLPQKSAQTFFQRLLMTGLLATQYFAAHFDSRSGGANHAWTQTDSAIHRADRIREQGLPQVRVRKHAQMPAVFDREKMPARRRTSPL